MKTKGSWKKHEQHIRLIAQIKHGTTAKPFRSETGVNHDCVLKLTDKNWIIIEITENHSLDKIRGDINRLVLTRTQLFTQQHVMCECIIVTKLSPTQSMIDGSASQGIKILSVDEYNKIFFDKTEYTTLRTAKRFGSAVDVFSGEPDNRKYIPVSYRDQNKGTSVSINNIAEQLVAGKNIVQTGSFGSGKSRCCKEVFAILSNLNDTYCIAIDLRNIGALGTANQIIRAHLEDLGMDKHSESLIRLFNAQKLIFILDGFDEMGGSQWSDDPKKLQEIRYKILKPIREIINHSHAVLISGREHYFNSNEEMISTLCGDSNVDLLLECKEEFSDEEIENFLAANALTIELPAWLPKRPLLCQILVELNDHEYPVTIDHDIGQATLWMHIISLIAKRESRISDNFEEGVILQILTKIARRSRRFTSDVEPIALEDLNWAYKAVRGFEPTDEDAVLLQKLPGLGRISFDSRDRRFVDKYILDGLRANDVCEIIKIGDEDVFTETWRNPVEPLGMVVIGNFISENALLQTAINIAKKSADRGNSMLSTDIVSSLAHSDEHTVDLRGLYCSNSTIFVFDMSEVNFENVVFEECIFYNLHVPSSPPKNVHLKSCIVEKVFGIPNRKGVPSWIDSPDDIFNFEEMGNVASIKNFKLSEPQRILCVILHKTFFQPGRGRQEEALLRGLGQIDRKGNTPRILTLLIHEGFLEKAKGRHGNLYLPVISAKGRAAQILNLLGQSKDPLWEEVSGLA